MPVSEILAACEDVVGFGLGFSFRFGDEVVLNLGGDIFSRLEVVKILVGEAFAKSTEAALAALVGCDGFEEMEAVEVGPEAIGDEDLGVCNLPEEKVGDALLAGGADDEVRVRHVCGVESAS